MAGRRDKNRRRSRSAKTRRSGRAMRRWGTGAGVFLGLGINSFGGTPTAHADFFGSIFDTIVDDITTAVSQFDTAVATTVNEFDTAVVTDINNVDAYYGLAPIPGSVSQVVDNDPASVGVGIVSSLTRIGQIDPVVDVTAGSGPATPVVLDTGSDALVLPSQDVPQGALFLAELNPLDYVHGGFGTLEYSGVEVEVPSVTIGEPSSGEVTTGNTEVVAVLSATDGSGQSETLSQYFGNNADGVLGIGPNETNDLAYTYNDASVPAQQALVTDALPGDLKDGEFLELKGSPGTGTINFGPSQDFISGPTTMTSGAPETPVLVQIDGGPKVPIEAIFDSGGNTGTIPSSLISSIQTENGPTPGSTILLPGSQISVYDTNGDLLYSYTTTATDTPDVSGDQFNTGVMPGDQINTGIAAFEYDANGNTNSPYDGIYVSNDPSGVGSLTVQTPPPPPPPGPTVVATINVGDEPNGVAVSPTGPEAGDIYVTNFTGYNVSVIDPSTNTVVGTGGAGENPDGVAVSPTGPEAGDIYVADLGNDEVTVNDPSTNAVVHYINFGYTSGPIGVAVSPTGPEAGDIYVTDPGLGTVSVIDPSTNTIVDTIHVDGDPFGIAVSPIGPEAGDIYTANDNTDGTVSVIDPSTNTVVDTINVGEDPQSVAVSPTGPEAGDVYVADSGDVQVIDPSTNTVVDTIDFGGGGGGSGLAVSPTGPEAGDIYVTGGNEGDGTVSVIDPSTNTVIDTISVGDQPSAVAVSPTGPEAGDIYVTNNGDNTVSVIQP